MQEDRKLIICPNETKVDILNNYNNSLHNIKFMSKKEFFDNYFFSYDYNAIFYLMKKYNYQLDVCRVYLNNLYVIDINKDYNDSKLNFLKNIKKELIENKLLYINNNFINYISKFKIEVSNYYDLDKYEENILNYKFEIPKVELKFPVYEFNSMEEEINFVCLKIIDLINSGIDINKIYLTNVSSDYLYTIDKLFKYYNIPINLNFNNSIYGTKVVQDYLKTGEIDLENKDKNIINKKLINVIGDLSSLDENDELYKKILIDKLKNTSFSNSKLNNAVNIKDFYKSTFKDSDYVFVLGFNQDSLPKMEKDISYINDSIRDEVNMYTTTEVNVRNKELVAYLLSKIKNIYVSYKLSSPFSAFYKSSLIGDLGLEVIKDNSDCYNHSNFYNKLRLGEKLDLFNLYGEESSYLKELNTHYSIPYKTYNNIYTGINKDLYLKNLPETLKLSYTSLNSYNECKFKYYVRNVLKIEDYEDTFAAFVGSMYHNILSLYRREDFDLEKEYNAYLEKRDLSLKEKLFLVRIKKDLVLLIDVLKKQQLLTGYDDYLVEKKAEVVLDKPVSVVFMGYIDKIMFYKKVEDTYFSIVDYKTGYIDTHIEPMKYGLHMQLPVYLYLIHYSKIFTNPIFTGIYYQNILFNYPSWSTKLEKEKADRYLLNGYSTDSVDVLARFDSTYEDSSYIKSMKYKDEKGFGTYSKVMDNDTLYSLIDYTKKHIDKKVDEILDGDFSINPKVYAGSNVSCDFCSFKDLCFMKDKDLVYLSKVDDLSFLGGEE